MTKILKEPLWLHKPMEKRIIYALISMVFAGLTSVVAKFGMKAMCSDSALVVRTASSPS